MQFTEENKVLIKHYRFTKEYGRTPFKLTNVQRLTRENEKKKKNFVNLERDFFTDDKIFKL